MTTPATQPDIPENIGRNDPCPCGSEKKYKKCCFRIHQVQREASKQNRGVEALIKPTTIPWKVYKLLVQAQENNMFSFFYDMAHELGPFRQKYPEASDFLQAVDQGEDQLPAAKRFELQRLRLDHPDVYMLMTAGHDDPKVDNVDFDVVVLRPNQYDADGNLREVEHEGFRVWDRLRFQRAKADLDDADLSLSDLGIEWHPR